MKIKLIYRTKFDCRIFFFFSSPISKFFLTVIYTRITRGKKKRIKNDISYGNVYEL